MGKSRSETPYVSVPLNTVLQLTPGAFVCEEKRHLLYVIPKELEVDGQDEKLANNPRKVIAD